MKYTRLRYQQEDGYALIVLNMPDLLNALDAPMRTELISSIERASTEARAIVITGAGDAFCSGQDLGSNAHANSVNMERILREEYMPVIRAIHMCPLPVIAAVNGIAAGAGANLALAADIVIASEKASFIQTSPRIGLMPDSGATYFLPRTLGFARAMGVAMLGEAISARKAQEWGMIWEACADGDFETCWKDRARQLAKAPGQALAAAKKAIRQSFDNGFDQQLYYEAKLQGSLGKTRDFLEGVSAFVEKRPPEFENR